MRIPRLGGKLISYSLIGLMCLGFIFFSIRYVYAYFTSAANSEKLSLQTGQINLALAPALPSSSDLLLPGIEQTAIWSVKNDGKIPVNLKLRYDFTDEQNRVLNDVKITKLAFERDNSWVDWITSPGGIEHEVYWSDDSSQNNLKTLNPGQEIRLKTTYQLPSNANDELQNQKYWLSLHAGAKQTNAGAEWPSSY